MCEQSIPQWMGILFNSRIFKTPIWANPLEAPAPKTTAILAGFAVTGSSFGAVAHENSMVSKAQAQIILAKRKTFANIVSNISFLFYCLAVAVSLVVCDAARVADRVAAR